MSTREFHVMSTELLLDTRTMRYRCATCGRCVEDGPDGIRIVHKGDLTVSHRGGTLAQVDMEVEQDVVPQRVLH